MAKTSALGLAIFCVFLVVSPTVVYSNKEIIVYAEVIAGSNIIKVAGRGPSPPAKYPAFGDLSVYDFPARESINTDSPIVGRIQGIGVISSLDGTRVYFSDSVIIERGKYKVGTVEYQGILRVSEGPTYTGELGITGGTESYRFVKGFIDVQTVRQFPQRNTTILQCKIIFDF